MYIVVNEDTSRNPIYVNKNGVIYNSIYNFREDIPTKKNSGSLRNENRVQERGL